MSVQEEIDELFKRIKNLEKQFSSRRGAAKVTTVDHVTDDAVYLSEHIVKVGSRVQIDDETQYREVTHIFGPGAGLEVDGNRVVFEHEITDVYTAEEFARNSALVQYGVDDNLASEALHEELADKWVFDTALVASPYLFLTTEATAALGTFTPVPDRPIKAGDCVRHVATKKVGILGWVHGQGGYLEEGSKWVKLSLLTHVAPEDPAYIEPIKPEPTAKYKVGQRVQDHGGYEATVREVLFEDVVRYRVDWDEAPECNGGKFQEEQLLPVEPRAVVLTLPDEVMEDICLRIRPNSIHVETYREFTPEQLKEYAAELYAAALKAEEIKQ